MMPYEVLWDLGENLCKAAGLVYMFVMVYADLATCFYSHVH